MKPREMITKAKDKKNKTTQPQQALEEEEKKVKVVLDKYLGKHVKKAAAVERKEQYLSVEDWSEEEQEYDSDDIPQKYLC